MCQQNTKCSLDNLSVKNVADRDDLSFLETKYIYKRSQILMLLLISKGRLPTFSNSVYRMFFFNMANEKLFFLQMLK